MDLNLNKLPWYAQIGLFIALSAAGVYAFYAYHAAPAEQEMAARAAQLASLRADINKGIIMARQLPEFQREVAQLQARLDIKSVLPEQKDVADLLNNIQTLAVQSSMTIRAFKPQPIKTQRLYEEWPIALELDGTYHNLAMFFDSVGRFSRIINISNIVIKGKENPGPGSTITAECVATTFVLLAQPKAPSVAGGN
jgi:type IV pilus assembly protein PilO